VRSVAQPLVLIVGFGATLGQWVTDWHARNVDAASPTRREDAASPTERELAWDRTNHPIGSVRLVNGAWCWLHNLDGGTKCIAFLKNHLEQSVKAVELAHLQRGDSLLDLKFRDVDLFPTICADVTGIAEKAICTKMAVGASTSTPSDQGEQTILHPVREYELNAGNFRQKGKRKKEKREK
jgi:hypothetical protein